LLKLNQRDTLPFSVPEFAPDKTYVYKYEALLLGGLPQEGLARAGIKVSSKVHLSAVTENTFLMKVMTITNSKEKLKLR